MSKNISIASIIKFSELQFPSIQPQEPSISMIWVKNESIYPILNFCMTDSLWTDSGLFSSAY